MHIKAAQHQSEKVCYMIQYVMGHVTWARTTGDDTARSFVPVFYRLSQVMHITCDLSLSLRH